MSSVNQNRQERGVQYELGVLFFLILKKKVLKFSRAYMYEHRQGHLRLHRNFSLLHKLKYCQKYNILYTSI